MGPFLVIVLIYFVIPLVLILGYKWFIAFFCVLTGDKEGLHECNLCEKPMTEQQWQDWRYKDRHYNNWRNYGEGDMS